MIKFFGLEGIEGIRKKGLFIPNNPKNLIEYRKNYLQDFALILIEGCVLCKNKNKPINIIFRQGHKEGPIKSICLERKGRKISNLTIDLNKNNGFVIGGIISERFCPSRENINSEIKLAPLRYKLRFRIQIEHSLIINLNNNRAKEEINDWNWENKINGLGYNYYKAITPLEMKMKKN
ncbi:hypothetical protein Mgra_00004603 [Meloidogyne graminicola]|uniref:Uncharacterized protein n=1 Tax=Meloidogyne graminicola TaxID=189291 RepID=A0A8S9ZRJ1_9BILA|nr:hypothetical protein Mgra_00004603 [Meloidogyne graminicola]